MAPSTWVSVLLFVILIAPGLLFDILSARRRVGAPESAFRETSRVILASLAFSGFAFLVIATIRTLVPAWMPDPTPLIADFHGYMQRHYRLVLRALVLELLLALAAASVAHAFLARRQGAGLRPVSAWVKVFRNNAPAGRLPYVRVRLTNGTVYMGYVAHYTANIEGGDREIVLSPPMFAKLEGKPLSPIPAEWERLVIGGGVIENINVQYRPAPSAQS
ncbi:DUF6338 family protein [Geodermatophilus siccatus]|uniref:DUF6338 family protein n=1 Tax=Geodermatophilus siccatus TaxID=1137991 RepID=UPI0011146051|nr:DUF6338 family protein [Geodermatophilus siccatus]